MRKCKTCGQMLPPEAFQREGNAPDGRKASCKPCTKMRRAGKHTKGSRHTHRDPVKNLARQRLRDAVRSGAIVKPGHCEKCLRPTPNHVLDGHHSDYTKPLQVEWLCRSCHGLEHMTWLAAA